MNLRNLTRSEEPDTGHRARAHSDEISTKTHLGPGVGVGMDRTWLGIAIWSNGVVLNWTVVAAVQLQRVTKNHPPAR